MWLAIVSALALAAGGVLLWVGLLGHEVAGSSLSPAIKPAENCASQTDVRDLLTHAAPADQHTTTDVISAATGAASAVGGLCGGVAAVIALKHPRPASLTAEGPRQGPPAA